MTKTHILVIELDGGKSDFTCAKSDLSKRLHISLLWLLFAIVKAPTVCICVWHSSKLMLQREL